MKKLIYSTKAGGYKQKGILGTNFSPNNVQLANNQQFGQSFDVKNIFRPYPLSKVDYGSRKVSQPPVSRSPSPNRACAVGSEEAP